MFFNFIFPGNSPGNNKETKTGLKSILNIKKQLVEMGYNPSEIDYLIKINGYKEGITKDLETIHKVETLLNNHLAIAKKCINVIQSEN